SVTTPVDAKNWIAHIEKIFEVLGCADEFKARLASYKLERDALNWLVGFVGKKAGPLEERAKHFKWALCDWTLDGIVNTEFTDVAQVANAARNIEILRERIATVIKRHGRTEVSSTTVLLGRQVRKDTRTMPPPPCDTCGKLHPGKACHRVTRACFTCGSTGHMAKNCPKNGGNGGKVNGNDNQPATKGRVFSLTKDQAANSSGTISGTLFLNGHAVFVLFDTGATYFVSDHEYQNCPPRFDDKIRFGNLLPLEMSDIDIILGMDWLAEHRALSFVIPIVSSLVI
ncbi:putative reverse transcriptase domain-containing protein, partial [Tanacetum coccineum]